MARQMVGTFKTDRKKEAMLIGYCGLDSSLNIIETLNRYNTSFLL